MRLVALRRDPRASARDVAAPLLFVKLDDSCDLTHDWPRTDPAFFDNAAVAFIARSLGRDANGYEGSFSYMSSKVRQPSCRRSQLFQARIFQHSPLNINTFSVPAPFFFFTYLKAVFRVDTGHRLRPHDRAAAQRAAPCRGG